MLNFPHACGSPRKLQSMVEEEKEQSSCGERAGSYFCSPLFRRGSSKSCSSRNLRKASERLRTSHVESEVAALSCFHPVLHLCCD